MTHSPWESVGEPLVGMFPSGAGGKCCQPGFPRDLTSEFDHKTCRPRREVRSFCVEVVKPSSNGQGPWQTGVAGELTTVSSAATGPTRHGYREQSWSVSRGAGGRDRRDLGTDRNPTGPRSATWETRSRPVPETPFSTDSKGVPFLRLVGTVRGPLAPPSIRSRVCFYPLGRVSPHTPVDCPVFPPTGGPQRRVPHSDRRSVGGSERVPGDSDRRCVPISVLYTAPSPLSPWAVL